MRFGSATASRRRVSLSMRDSLESGEAVEEHHSEAEGVVSLVERRSRVTLARGTPLRLFLIAEVLIDGFAALAALLVSDVLALSLGLQVVWYALAVLAWWGLLAGFKVYGAHRQAPGRALLGAAGVAGAAAAMIGAARAPVGLASRLAVGMMILGAVELIGRGTLAYLRHRGRAGGWLRLRTAIVGDETDPEGLRQLLLSSDCDMLPVARIGVAASNGGGHDDPLPRLGEIDDIPQLLHEGGIDCLLVGSGSMDRERLEFIRRVTRKHQVDLRLLSQVPEALPSSLHVYALGHNAIVTIPQTRLTGSAARVKRSMDIILGSFGLLIALVPMALIAVSIKLTSAGPVFFRQTRVTQGGRSFRVIKFRTMAPAQGPGQLIDLTQPFFKLRDDPRLTKVGRILRSLSLDELPQLWNVVVGEMSLVGPRPLPLEQVEAHPELLGTRHEVRAGITGWWQVNGRSDVSPSQAVEHDLFYIENWSLSLDLRILASTAFVLIHRRGAY